MSTKSLIKAAMLLIALMAVIAIAPNSDAKGKKIVKEYVETEAVSGCVVNGFAAEQFTAASGSATEVVEVKQSPVPLSSLPQFLKDKKEAAKIKHAREKKLKAQRKKEHKKYKRTLCLLATLTFLEAGGQSYAGTRAVAASVMNRVNSSYYPNTITKVILQPHQFRPIHSGRMASEIKLFNKGVYEKDIWRVGALRAAEDILKGKYIVKYKGRTLNLHKYTNFMMHMAHPVIHIDVHDFA